MADRQRSTTERAIRKVIFFVLIPLLVLSLIYVYGLTHPDKLHKEHEYMGYTYYSSILNTDFDENDAIYAFDSIMGNEKDYIFILDDFYNDGYRIYFDDKFTYAWCTGDLLHGNEFSAAVTYNRDRSQILSGMFVNYENDYFSEKIFFHELSHYVDFKMGYLSQTDEFKAIFDEEYKNSTLSERSYYSDIREYFAEESAYYIIEDSYEEGIFNQYGKYEDAPRTFDYMKSVYEKMREIQ